MTNRIENRAIVKSKSVKSCLYDPKHKDMGSILVEDGTITIKLDYFDTMMSEEASLVFLTDEIKEALVACFEEFPETFDPYS